MPQIPPNYSDKAIAAAASVDPDYEFRITNTANNILDGWLVTATGRPKLPQASTASLAPEKDLFVLVRDDNATVFYDLEEFAKAASNVTTREKVLVERLVDSVGMPGVLALIITITIIYIVAKGDAQTQVPEVLSNALGVIIGFYFGTKVMAKKEP